MALFGRLVRANMKSFLLTLTAVIEVGAKLTPAVWMPLPISCTFLTEIGDLPSRPGVKLRG
jgi:hypothetical protein